MTDQPEALPPFSGDDPVCPKCGNEGASTRYRAYGQCMHGINESVRGFDPNERLHRECQRCDYPWDEALATTDLEPAPVALRDRYAAAIASYDHAVGQATDPAPGNHHHGQADAVLAVRDRELEQLRASANGWRRKAIRRAIRLGRHETTLDAIREMTAEEVKPQNPWCDGYRQALADLTEIIDTLNPTEQS